MYGKRSQLADLGKQTVAILQAGGYSASGGRFVSLKAALHECVRGTVTYRPHTRVPIVAAGTHETCTEVTHESTLEAAQRLVQSGQRVAALNFASAKNPGGGFLRGARAQEESLARSSGLYACLLGNEMYTYHRQQADALYSSYALYSPDVPVFRNEAGALLAEPWPCSFITCAAVNVGALHEVPQATIRAAMEERIDKVLAIAVAHGHEAIVLGAWGCGVFRNDTAMIAALFHDALTVRFQGAFRHVVFAVLDSSAERRFIGPFQRAFCR